ncbi:MAG: sugar transferase [Fimbriimonadaceae bacterium]|nr:sugar transferase [Fimbriimonadaceae bacterium]QYK56086.1 MAG: sugar transferase [Fimbriimonadaceae bacterium]
MLRLIDFLLAAIGLVLLSPVLLVFMVLVWAQDRKSPFYLAPRVARGGGTFTMVKLRSMVVNADKSGVNSTASGDRRITPIGQLIRKFKLDELTQLWNVLVGEMSLVGPRPQVRADVDLYTDAEREMLTVLPGITDLASITFSDEGEILAGQSDPDLAYNQLIRPWKSRLALFTLRHRTVDVYFRVIWLTAMAVLNKPAARAGVQRLLRKKGADAALVEVAARSQPLLPTPPPGSDEVVTSLTPRHAVVTPISEPAPTP